ncbi:MAG: hypothetical protein WGN25_08195 [Candidatus Electrothrix sp. GW3-4]|uniref:hypothetical protein n=1 Tax=Candidatus Electrothrix sp. GW3-4 TaxID=3126740 RepID=UPI0030CD7D51
MNQEDDLPTDEEELIELAKKIIKAMTNNPKFSNLPVSVSEMQESLDKLIKTREAEAAICEEQKRVKKKLQAAWEDVCSAQQRIRAYNRKHGIRDNSTNLLASGMPGLANRVFSQLPDQDDTLQIPKKDKNTD